MEPSIFLTGFIFLFGLAIGSFLNVVICRIPLQKSIIYPPSHCPKCGHRITALENIPLLSYVMLRGRCSKCKSRISIQYPLVELVTGTLFALVAWKYGFTFKTLVYLAFSGVLISLAVIDVKTKLLPDVITLPAAILASLLSVTTLYPFFTQYWEITPWKAFSGMLAGAGPLAILAYVYFKVTGREGMGIGDIKLMIFIGALLGPWNAALTLFLGAITGTLAGIPTVLLSSEGRRTEIPFGPFLSTAAYIAALWGEDLFVFYSKLSGFVSPGL